MNWNPLFYLTLTLYQVFLVYILIFLMALYKPMCLSF